MKKIVIHTDGGSRGNPGPGAAGFTLADPNGKTFLARGVFLGETTNNIAEYRGLIEALKAVKEFDPEFIQIYSDSQLMVKQLEGLYRVKSENLKGLYKECICLLQNFDHWEIGHVYRSKNKKADEMANLAMDRKSDIEQKRGISKDSKQNPIRLGVLISGGGRTLLNLDKMIKTGYLNAKINIVISSRNDIAGVERARAAGYKVQIVRKRDFENIDSFSKNLEEVLVNAGVDLVIQAGWLCLWRIPEVFKNKVMNIHPGLLPGFGGKGMWGHHVHEAVLKAGCKISGCTVHFCNNEYDEGPIIIQRCCEVKSSDDPNSLAERVFEQECIAYPEAINLFAGNRLSIENSIVKIR